MQEAALNPAADADVAVGMAGGGGEEVDVAFLQCLQQEEAARGWEEAQPVEHPESCEV